MLICSPHLAYLWTSGTRGTKKHAHERGRGGEITLFAKQPQRHLFFSDRRMITLAQHDLAHKMNDIVAKRYRLWLAK